jgi:hypothetical protein
MTLLVVHLVRRQNGLQPFHDFLDSYASRSAGVAHNLVLALKGFESEAASRSCLEAISARGLAALPVLVPDDGFDLTAYARVVDLTHAERYCFLNSFSRVLADQWLAHLVNALDEPDVELAGATGSWTSHRDYRRYHVGLPSGYDGVFNDRERTRQGFLELVRGRNPGKRDYGRLAFRVGAALALLRERGASDPFPARHLRTNAFVASRELMLGMGFPRIRRKRGAYRLESGPASFTRRVEGMHRRAVVVGCDGSVYDSERWNESLTFWQGTQQNLLVADNQTDDYTRADATGRELFSRLAWGKEARPA